MVHLGKMCVLGINTGITQSSHIKSDDGTPHRLGLIMGTFSAPNYSSLSQDSSHGPPRCILCLPSARGPRLSIRAAIASRAPLVGQHLGAVFSGIMHQESVARWRVALPLATELERCCTSWQCEANNWQRQGTRHDHDGTSLSVCPMRCWPGRARQGWDGSARARQTASY